MNNKDNTTVENTATETVSEYKIGHTLYTVKTVFTPASMESLSDILKRLIIRECEDFLGESRQEPEKQAV
ncbi:MAG: transposon-encoded TnpW family protein [Ruminococcus sp.]|nr:transposon-encoded TnpW family protein [Ruminococcus sp.]